MNVLMYPIPFHPSPLFCILSVGYIMFLIHPVHVLLCYIIFIFMSQSQLPSVSMILVSVNVTHLGIFTASPKNLLSPLSSAGKALVKPMRTLMEEQQQNKPLLVPDNEEVGRLSISLFCVFCTKLSPHLLCL